MKNSVSTDKAPGAIGPYSQGVIAGNLIFTSGQLPIEPNTGLMPDTIEAQTNQSLKNAAAIIEAAGSSMAKVVKTTVFLKDMNDFEAMNKVYKEYFQAGSYPARSAVQVARLPKDALVEIEMIACK